MKKTYSGKRVYEKQDIGNAVDVVRQAFETAGKDSGHYTEKEVNAVVHMLQDIADGMCWDDAIVCSGNDMELVHGSVDGVMG